MERFATRFNDLAQFIVSTTALAIDLIAAVVIAFAGFYAFFLFVGYAVRRSVGEIPTIRLHLGLSLVLALEFLIGADILRTAITPSWTLIGQLGAIILLRTLLEFLLERELGEVKQSQTSDER